MEQVARKTVKEAFPILWSAHIETDLTEQNIKGFQDLGVKFFRLFDKEESVLGHKILRADTDDTSLLLITRRYDYSQSLSPLPGVELAISSSKSKEHIDTFSDEIVAIEGVMKALDPNYQPTFQSNEPEAAVF